MVHDESMRPVLRSGDRLLVDAGAYRHRPPEVGEVVVFVDPSEPGRWLIKRIAGVGPGRFLLTSSGLVPVPDGEKPDPLPKDAIDDVVLPESFVYVTGDGPGARDSRTFGPVPRTALVGRAYRCYAPAARRREL